MAREVVLVEVADFDFARARERDTFAARLALADFVAVATLAFFARFFAAIGAPLGRRW
jgi:hypothetical protein